MLLGTAIGPDPEPQGWGPSKLEARGGRAQPEAAQAARCSVPLLAEEEQNSHQIDVKGKLQCNNTRRHHAFAPQTGDGAGA